MNGPINEELASEIRKKLEDVVKSHLREESTDEEVTSLVAAVLDFSTDVLAGVVRSHSEDLDENGPDPEMLNGLIHAVVTGIGEKSGVEVKFSEGELPDDFEEDEDDGVVH